MADEGRCDLCAVPLPERHAHLAHIADGRLVCACTACALLLGHQPDGPYRRVPERVRALPGFRMSDAEWDALGIPVDLAFFMDSTRAGRTVALYPSPFGTTECQLVLESWNVVAAANAELSSLMPDVEALLVDRRRGRREAYLVPIDLCYRLSGIVRMRWRGLSGGDAPEAVDRFVDELRSRSETAA